MADLQFVPTLSFVTMGISIFFSVAIPTGLFIFFRKKYGCNRKPFFIGCAVFAVFALILENIVHSVVLSGGRADAIMAKPLLYGLYGGFMAGLFEETGRFLAFKTILKKSRGDDRTALMYGAGHGGFEAFFILFSAMITNIVYAVMINSGNTTALTANLDAKSLAVMEQAFTTLKTTNPVFFLAGIIERISTVAIHISLSVLVWFAAKDRKSLLLYPLAILIHLIIDAAVAAMGVMKVNTVAIEAVCYAGALICCLTAYFVWKKKAVKNQAENADIVLE